MFGMDMDRPVGIRQHYMIIKREEQGHNTILT
jgi:hypothetical protein